MDENVMKTAKDYLEKAGLDADQIVGLERIGYFKAPASCRHHLAVKGGLAEHSVNVTKHILELGAFRSFVYNPRSPYLVGMLHDLVKCMCYEDAGDGVFRYVVPPYPGHGVASVMIAQELGIALSPLEAACIAWHMGAFGLNDEEMKHYSAAVRRCPHAIILTHAADHLASVCEDILERK